MSSLFSLFAGLFEWIKIESFGDSDEEVDGNSLQKHFMSVRWDSTQNDCIARLKEHQFKTEDLRLFSEICRDQEGNVGMCPASLEIIFHTAKFLKLPLEPLLLSCKDDWFRRLLDYQFVTAYYMQMGRFGHWKLIVVTDSNVYVLIELKAYEFKDRLPQFYRDSILMLDKSVADQDRIIIPSVLCNADPSSAERKAMKKLRVKVPYAALMGVVMLDPQIFQRYDYFTNNCQQYVRRIYNAVIRPFITTQAAEAFERDMEAQREALLRDHPCLSAGTSLGNPTDQHPDGANADGGVEAWNRA